MKHLKTLIVVVLVLVLCVFGFVQSVQLNKQYQIHERNV